MEVLQILNQKGVCFARSPLPRHNVDFLGRQTGDEILSDG